MEIYGYSLNSTSTKNNTNFYYFCTERPVGPLIWAIFNVPSACVGIPASGWLLWLLVQMQRSGSSNNFYLLNLTIMDLGFNLSVIPFTINFFAWQNITFARLTMVFNSFSHTGRPLFTAFICIDCYLAVVYPISYMRMSNRRYRMALCTLVWLLSCIYPFFSLTNLPLIVFIQFLSTVPPIIFCNMSTLYVLRKPGPSGRQEIHPQKQRAKQIILNSLVVTLLSNPPTMIGAVCALTNMSPPEILCNVVFPTFISASIGSFVMPLLYLGNLGKLKGFRLLGCVRAE